MHIASSYLFRPELDDILRAKFFDRRLAAGDNDLFLIYWQFKCYWSGVWAIGQCPSQLFILAISDDKKLHYLFTFF